MTAVTPGELRLFNPGASGIQALSIKPGIQINGYNATSGTARSTISMRGVKVGWNSVPGDLETNGITAEFDGVPLNSLIQGTGWHSVEIPLGPLLAGVNVLYGPSNPRDRWYDSIGGTVNFIPVQPSRDPQASVSAGYGSDQSQVYTAIASTGEHDGWSAVLATAYTHNHNFRISNFNTPARANQVYLKLRKEFSLGAFSVGAYWQRNDEYRPNMIPIDPIPGVTVAGLNQNAPLYSQKTSGFYSALNPEVWFKNNIIENYLAYSKLRLKIADDVELHDLFWYRHGRILHYRINTGFAGGDSEYYYPYSETYGNRLVVDAKLPYHNKLSFGGYVINSNTDNRFKGYNALQGYPLSNPSYISFNKFRNTFVSAFIQDQFAPVRALKIVPGLQFVQYQTSFTNNNLAESVNYPNAAYNTNPNTSRTFSRLAPSVGVTFTPSHWLSVYANYAMTYQNPTGGNFNNAQTDLPALKPVKSTDYEIGVRLRREHWLGLQRVSGEINYYSDILSDETIPVALASNPTVITFGYGKATLNGINLSLDADIDDNWSTYLNASYLHGYYNSYFSTTTNQFYDGYPVTDSPYLTAALGAKYKSYFAGNGVEVNLWDQYYGHSYLFDNNAGAPTRQQIPGYNLLNLSITVRNVNVGHFIPGVKMASVAVYLTNILNRKYNATEYVTAGGYFNGNSAGAILDNPGDPRAFFVDARLKF
ncbi:MAG: TonB-dependent receptor [Acidithiobacillus caldus]|nr:TonB-dependent receptor [Acidithiobacillus caldus]